MYSQHKPVPMWLHLSPVHGGGGAEAGVLEHGLAEGTERERGDPGLVPQLGDGLGRVAEARHHRAEGGHQVVFVQSLEEQRDKNLGYRRGESNNLGIKEGVNRHLPLRLVAQENDPIRISFGPTKPRDEVLQGAHF